MSERSPQQDLEEILSTGITHTGDVIELMKKRGWKDIDLLPLIYKTLLRGRVDPNGSRIPYRAN